MKKLVYQNGATEEYFYNEDQTLKKLLNTYNDHKDEFIYEYDNNKNIVFKNEKGKESTYTYDALNRLKTIGEVTYEEIGNEELERVETLLTTYLYDKNGNRIKEISLDNTKEYIYDSNNKLTKLVEKENNVTTKTTVYTYDKNGNELTETENGVLKVTNTYNGKNELVKTVVDSKETNYVYNAEGKRIEKQNDKTIKYVYEGLDVILELDENNNEIGHNVYGLALVSRNNSSKGYYLYNGHGDTVTIVDLEENVLNNYTYDEWGVIIESDGEFNNPYRYAGYYYDSETDNYYLLSRYYNPEIGRFISEDSYRGDYNDPLSLNRYVYVTNNPLIYVDPEGYFGKTLQKFFGGLWDETWNFGITLGATIHGGGQALGDMTIGLGQTVIDGGTLFLYGSASIGNEIYHDLGIFGEEDYQRNLDRYTDKLIESGSRLNPVNAINGIKDNFSKTFNINNLEKFMDKDTSYFDKVEYAKEATYTATTIYGAYKTGQGIYNKVTSPSSFGQMSSNDAANYNNYWKQVEQGLTVEQRYNFQKFGTVKTFADYMTLDDAANYNQYWEQVKQGLTAEQRYNYANYGSFEGMSIQYNPITGYTRHGLNSAISHDGVGIQPSSILDTVKNPTEIKLSSNHTVRYVGKEGIVNLNYDGEIVTTWAKGSKYRRVK